MPHISAAVEYGLHCLVFLASRGGEAPAPSARDLAELQGVPVDYAAKIFTRLQKAGLVVASEGVRGGMRLARPADAITMHDVVIAIDGARPLFDCREIRGGCALFRGDPPRWATAGVCGIHAVMMRAEARMRDELKAVTLAQLAGGFGRKAPDGFFEEVAGWLDARAADRTTKGKEQAP
ncbi:MAG: Rrf2 family transcriptional regulator [Sphingobium sp.]